MKYMDKMMKTILWKGSLMEVISFKAIAFIGGEGGDKQKNPEPLINFHHLPVNTEHSPLFTKTQTLVRQYAFCVVSHLELTRFWTFPLQVHTTLPKKMVQCSVE